jgi:CubicO group peptidase (beta-lactamase class C family)
MRSPTTIARELAGLVDAAAAAGFSGAVRLDIGGEIAHQSAHGWSHRAHRVANTIDTKFGIASGAKAFTALVVMALVERGALGLGTTARSLLADDLPLIDEMVTIEHLLSHRSGIGDYLDETTLDHISEYAMPIGVHRLAGPEDYLAVLGGHPMTFNSGTRFVYNNAGFAVLAILAERASGRSFFELVDQYVCEPAGLAATGFLRSDELPSQAATGYLHDDTDRTNVLHLPVRGSGDGGIYTTVADIHRLWAALFKGRVVNADTLAKMMTPQGGTDNKGYGYGLGFWINGRRIQIEGYDAGVSFRGVHHPEQAVTWTVVSNTSEGVWPLAKAIAELIDATPNS